MGRKREGLEVRERMFEVPLTSEGQSKISEFTIPLGWHTVGEM